MSTFKTSDSASIHYSAHGKGKPLVFIHGFSLDETMWAEQVAFFSKSFRVITYDMRGFGLSSLPNGAYSHAHDLFELLQHLQIPTADIVGLSLGGEVAIDFTLEHPDLVKNLVLVDSSLGNFSSTVNWFVKDENNDLEKTKQNWLKHDVFATVARNLELQRKLSTIVKNYSGWHWFNHDPRQKIENPSTKERLSEIEAETLILVGENDLQYYHDIAIYLEINITRSTKISIPKSGHLGNLENPEFFNSIVEKFLAG